MTAIDKIYVGTYEEYKLFKDWCVKQLKLKDKYGVEVSLLGYLYKYDEKHSQKNKSEKHRRLWNKVLKSLVKRE